MNHSLKIAMNIKLAMRETVIQWNRSQELQNRVRCTPVLTCHIDSLILFYFFIRRMNLFLFSGAFPNSHSLAWKVVPKPFLYNNMEFWKSHLPSINFLLHCHHCRLFVADREWDRISHWLSRNGSLIGAGIQGRGKDEHEQTFTTFCSKKNVDRFPLKRHYTISYGCLKD